MLRSTKSFVYLNTSAEIVVENRISSQNENVLSKMKHNITISNEEAIPKKSFQNIAHSLHFTHYDIRFSFHITNKLIL